MLFSKANLCVMLLYNFFITSNSTNEVICIVDDNHIGYESSTYFKQSPGFWEHFPCKAACTRHVLMNTYFDGAEKSINKFKDMMTTINQEKNEMAFMIGNWEYARYRWQQHLPVIKSHFNGVYICWLRRPLNRVSERLEFMEEVIREMRRLKKTASQGVFCIPDNPEVIRVGHLSRDADMTIIHIFLPDPKKFRIRAIFYMCVLPVLDHGIPKDKIVVGRFDFFGTHRVRDCCKEDKEKTSVYINFSLRMTHFVKVQFGLAGVMVYSLDGDDYTGQECGLGKYPFLRAYVGDLLDSCTSSEVFVSAAIVVNPTIVNSLIYLVVLTILFEGFY